MSKLKGIIYFLIIPFRFSLLAERKNNGEIFSVNDTNIPWDI